MALIFLLTLILAPLVEISIFIAVGEEIGVLAVIGLTIATTAIGLTLVRAQGIGTALRARHELEANRAPVPEMLHGALLVIAGLLLLIPGFLTDSLGILLLIPFLRTGLITILLRRLQPGSATIIIEGEFTEQSGNGFSDSDSRIPIEGEIILPPNRTSSNKGRDKE